MILRVLASRSDTSSHSNNMSQSMKIEPTSPDGKDEELIEWIQQMMFVSGETAEPSVDTTGMIEEIVRQQVIEIVSLTSDLIHLMGSL